MDSENFVVRCMQAQQAMIMSREPGEAYMFQHTSERSGLSHEDVGFLAGARLEWLLNSARAELSGQFDAGEFQELLSFFQGEVFYPGILDGYVEDMSSYLVSEVEEEWGHELRLKLQNLPPVQRLALADALEQACYRSERSKSALEVMAELGIDIA